MDMNNYMERSTVLVEALPYIQKWYGKTIVIKYGGNAMISEELRSAVISDIILLHLVGIQVVVVHGGGPEITETLGKMGKKSAFVDGVRVTDEEAVGVVLTWSGEAAAKPQYPFDTDVKDYFSLLYNTDFWKDGSLKTDNFEFDSRCPGSKYIPSLEKELEKLSNSLLQQENCTWAFLGNPYDGRESERYLFWTSLNTNKVGGGVKIPVIIQTGDGKYYVSHTTTGERENQSGKYIAVSKHLYNDQQYKSVLKAGEKYDSLTAAYVAYLLALEEYEKSALDSN